MTFKEFQKANPCNFNCDGLDVEQTCECYGEFMRVLSTTQHPKCKGYTRDTLDGPDHGCGYGTTITCDQCRYLSTNLGRGKDPEAKCNQP